MRTLPEREQDAEGRLRLIRVGAVGATLLTAGLAATRLLLDDSYRVALVLAATAGGFAATAALTRLGEKGTSLSRWTLPLVGWSGVSAMAMAEGGLHSEALFWLPFAPLLAAIGGGGRAVVWLTVVASASPVLLWIRAGSLLEPAPLLKVFGIVGAVVFAGLLGVQYERFRASSIRQLEGKNRALTEARELLQIAMENLKGGVAITDESAALVAVNAALLELFGIDKTEQEVVGHNTWSVLADATRPPADLSAFKESVQAATRDRRSLRREEIKMADGRVYERDCIPIVLGGDVHGHLWSYFDVTARATESLEMLDQIHTDPLTGAHSRVYVENELALHCHDRKPFAIIFVDLDGFKDVNDRHGHEAGDAVLCGVVERVRVAIRESDILGRMGGDEFVIVLPGLAKRAALERAANDVLDAVAVPLSHHGEDVAVGASLGVARFPDDGTDLESLLRAADGAMYVAKKAGKARFHFAGSRRPQSEDTDAPPADVS